MENKLCVLIVDDIKDNRLAIKIALKREGYELYEAQNGKEALKMCVELNPDVILMDALMPEMDGYESTKAIRDIEEFSRTPILMITALNDKDDKIKALEVGVNDFITKPFDKHELIARCRSYANMSKINNKYILASKHEYTNLPNKTALLDEIKECTKPKLFLIGIEDYELIEEFYTEEIASQIEEKYSLIIKRLLAIKWSSARLYHTSEGEFAILIDDIEENMSVRSAYDNSKRLYESTRRYKIALDDHEYNISVQISYTDSKTDTFEYARIGLNHAKKERESIIYANDIVDAFRAEAQKNIKMIKTIKEALDENRVVSFFQPIYNNKTKKIEKYESLVRIVERDAKVISPFFFLDIAKKSRYYNSITQRVIENSFKALELTDKEISINISALDIEDENITSMVLELLKENKDKATRVVFELLEDEVFKDFEYVKRFICEIKSYGAKIAIDDFGAGYSNFERLLDFQPDIVKIDGSLIKNIEQSELSRTIVETIQDFATKMDIKTVAEFVSSKEIFDIVNSIGIDYTQGYYIDEPKKEIG